MAKATADIRSLARAQTALAIRTLTGVCGSKAAPAAARVSAAQRPARPGLGQTTAGRQGGRGPQVSPCSKMLCDERRSRFAVSGGRATRRARRRVDRPSPRGDRAHADLRPNSAAAAVLVGGSIVATAGRPSAQKLDAPPGSSVCRPPIPHQFILPSGAAGQHELTASNLMVRVNY